MAERERNESGRSLALDIVGIVAVGVALGIAFNALQLAAGPRHGLAWIRREPKLASLETLAPPVAADTSAVAPVAAGAATASPARTPGATGVAKSTWHAPATPSEPHAAAPVAAGATPPRAAAARPTPSSAGQAAATSTSAPPDIPDTREPLEAQYASVRRLYDAGAAVFVDARSPEEYAESHIAGAQSLPFDDVFKDPDRAKALDTRGRPVVVTYCGGGDCDLSRNLAFALIEAGHKKVLVFMGGLPGWKEAGGPVATGTSPGMAP